MVLAKADGQWRIADAGDFPADAKRVEQLLERLGGLRTGTPVATSASARARFKVAEREFERRWQVGGLGFVYAYPDMTSDPQVNKHATDFVHRKIAEKVKKPEVAARLVPSEYPIGGRRLCVDNGYYETFNRDNVTLVDLRTEPLLGMTRALGVEYADKGIRVNAIAPGYIETQIVEDYWQTFPDPAAERQRVADIQPPKRLGRPEEIAATAVFLASDEAPFLNAEVIVVDGGRSAVFHD